MHAAPDSDRPIAFREPLAQLRSHARWAGVLLAAAFLLPKDTWNDGPRVFWELAPDLRLAGAWFLCAPLLAAGVLSAASFACRRGPPLALTMLTAMAALLFVMSAGSGALAWDMLPVPTAWAFDPAPSIAVASMSIGAILVASKRPRVSRGLIDSAALLAVVHLFLPSQGESPLFLVARVLPHVAASSSGGNLVSASLLSIIALWPAFSVLLAWKQTRNAAPAFFTGLVALHGVPVLLMPIVIQWLQSPGGSFHLAPTLSGILALTAASFACSSAAAHLAVHTAGRSEWPTRRAIMAGASILGTCMAITWTLRSPPVSNGDWQLGMATPQGERVWSKDLPRWNDRQKQIDMAGRSSAEARAEVVHEAELLAEAARAMDPSLGNALEALARESAMPELTERRWYHLVGRVNEASRAAGLPYYLDPTGMIWEDGLPPRRWFRVDPYRIERANPFQVGSRHFTTLHVRAMAPYRGRPAALGLSRDLEPFAVVVLDAIDDYAQDLEELASRASPRCLEAAGVSEIEEKALTQCGEQLARMAKETSLRGLLLDLTERHEVQHQIDGPAMAPSGWVRTRLSWVAPWFRRQVQRELSAYLAQMTAPGLAPRLTLVRLLRMVALSRRDPDTAAAMLVFEALEDKPNGGPGRERAARAFVALVGEEDAALRTRAARVWKRVFGEALVGVGR